MQNNLSDTFEFIKENSGIFCCPKCGGDISCAAGRLRCGFCPREFPIEEGIPLLFCEEDNDAAPAVTRSVKAFYEKTPFPNYDSFDSMASLVDNARKGVFARLLDEQIPFGARIIECGCGTGQLSAFLSTARRTVIGADMCLHSLKLARDFKTRNDLRRVHFIQMNLFHPACRPGQFDLVICNGVLHHTPDPFLGFAAVARLVRPGGYILIGLYHRFSRVWTDIRRAIFRTTGGKFFFLDKRLADAPLSEAARRTWYQDQYENPHESKHTIGEVMGWFEQCGFGFVKSVPKPDFFTSLEACENLFKEEPPVSRFSLLMKEISMGITNTANGGFFIVIGKKTG